MAPPGARPARAETCRRRCCDLGARRSGTVLAGAGAWAFAVQGVASRPWPGWQLPAGAPILHEGAYSVHQDHQCSQYGGQGDEKEVLRPGIMGSGGGAGVEVGVDLHGGSRDEQAAARSSGRPGQRPAAGRGRRPSRAGRERAGRRGRDVGGQCGQVGAGPRGQRLAHPRVELSLGQPSMHEGGLQRLDHLLAVGVTRPEPVTARRCPVLRSCHHQHLLPARWK